MRYLSVEKFSNLDWLIARVAFIVESRFREGETPMALFVNNPKKGSMLEVLEPSPAANSVLPPVTVASRPRPRLEDLQAKGPPIAEEPTCLSRGSKVSGKVIFGGSGRIDCELDGEVTAENRLYIGQLAIVTAKIKAASIVVAGKVTGDLTASQKIEIRPSAKVTGNIQAPVLVIQEGAHFRGQCLMPEATQEDRKLTVFPSREERVKVVRSASPREPGSARNSDNGAS